MPNDPQADGPSGRQVARDVMAPMRDGVGLATDIYLPLGDGPFPVVLARNPYGKSGDDPGAPDPYTPRGYAFVMQDCRGTGLSEGEWEPFVHDRADGLDTHAWVLAQPWCDGSICTTGGSYLGWTQWSVAADTGPAHRAMFTTVPLTDWHRDAAYIGGAFGLGLMMAWGAMMARPSASQPDVADWETWNWADAYRHLPLSTWDTQTSDEIPYLREWVRRPTYDEYWAQGATAHRVPSIDVPAITVAGWYDVFANHAFRTVSGLRELGRSDHHLIVGPWAHDTGAPAGERDFGPDGGFDALDGIELAWFDHHVRGEAPPELPPYRIFVMGRNEWRDEEAWPLPDTRFTPCYLREGGALSVHAPGAEAPDHYVYDPDNPVPTRGGCILFDTPAGALDQSDLAERPDVLVYTGDILRGELEVTGPVAVILYAASDALDTDWTAKLVDIHPDGRAHNLCDGVLRARHREEDAPPSLIEPGRVYRYTIDLWVTSNVFLPGHRVGVHISSSNFPRVDRSPNTGHEFGVDAELAVARQTVFHDADRPSHILLPITPRRE